MCCTPSSRNNKRHLPRRATRLSVSLRWPARAKTGKTASALRYRRYIPLTVPTRSFAEPRGRALSYLRPQGWQGCLV